MGWTKTASQSLRSYPWSHAPIGAQDKQAETAQRHQSQQSHTPRHVSFLAVQEHAGGPFTLGHSSPSVTGTPGSPSCATLIPTTLVKSPFPFRRLLL